MNKITCYVLATILLIVSCGKKNSEPTEYPINDTLKAHFNFQVGTYWIYKDSISGEEDSFYVSSNVFSKQKVSDQNIYDNIYISIVQQPINPPKAKKTDWYESLELHSIRLNTDYPPMMYPFTTGIIQSPSPAGSWGVILNIYSIFLNNGNTFNNVAEINDTFQNSAYNDWIYVNDSVGIIKMKINHLFDTTNNIWQIERWKLIK